MVKSTVGWLCPQCAAIKEHDGVTVAAEGSSPSPSVGSPDDSDTPSNLISDAPAVSGRAETTILETSGISTNSPAMPNAITTPVTTSSEKKRGRVSSIAGIIDAALNCIILGLILFPSSSCAAGLACGVVFLVIPFFAGIIVILVGLSYSAKRGSRGAVVGLFIFAALRFAGVMLLSGLEFANGDRTTYVYLGIATLLIFLYFVGIFDVVKVKKSILIVIGVIVSLILLSGFFIISKKEGQAFTNSLVSEKVKNLPSPGMPGTVPLSTKGTTYRGVNIQEVDAPTISFDNLSQGVTGLDDPFCERFQAFSNQGQPVGIKTLIASDIKTKYDIYTSGKPPALAYSAGTQVECVYAVAPAGANPNLDKYFSELIAP